MGTARAEQDVLGCRPVRLISTPPTPRNDGGARLTVSLQPTGWRARLLPRVKKTFEFDHLGLSIWTMCDGQTTVREMTRALARHYKLEPGAAETSARTFLKMLVKEGLVGMKNDGSVDQPGDGRRR